MISMAHAHLIVRMMMCSLSSSLAETNQMIAQSPLWHANFDLSSHHHCVAQSPLWLYDANPSIDSSWMMYAISKCYLLELK